MKKSCFLFIFCVLFGSGLMAMDSRAHSPMEKSWLDENDPVIDEWIKVWGDFNFGDHKKTDENIEENIDELVEKELNAIEKGLYDVITPLELFIESPNNPSYRKILLNDHLKKLSEYQLENDLGDYVEACKDTIQFLIHEKKTVYSKKDKLCMPLFKKLYMLLLKRTNQRFNLKIIRK